MSTVMYMFKAEDDAHLQQQIAEVREIVAGVPPACMEDGIEMQVFRTTQGILWRVLEAGYMLHNRLWDNPGKWPTCNYDNRTDVPEEDEENEAVASEVDWLIKAANYTVINVSPWNPERLTLGAARETAQ